LCNFAWGSSRYQAAPPDREGSETVPPIEPSHLPRPASDSSIKEVRHGAAAVWPHAASANETALLARFLGSENRFLTSRVEVLERRLRRRTVALGCGLLASLSTAAVLAILLFVDTPLGMLERSGTSVASVGPVAATAAMPVAESRSASSGSAATIAPPAPLAGSVALLGDGRSQRLERLELEDKPGTLSLPLGEGDSSPSAGFSEPIRTDMARGQLRAFLQRLSAQKPTGPLPGDSAPSH
jgi:hypothetical protein